MSRWIAADRLSQALALLTLLLALVALVAATPLHAQVTLIAPGQPVATIYVSPPASEHGDAAKLSQAASELQTHLQAITGQSVRIQQAAGVEDLIATPAIVLGSLAQRLGATPAKPSPTHEGFALKTDGQRVLVAGQSDTAVLHGTYELLRRLGVDWVMPGDAGLVLPQTHTVIAPAMDESHAPSFQVRRLWYRGWRPRVKADYDRFAQWLDRQKVGQAALPQMGAAGHVWDRLIRENQAAFDADPTMLALVRDVDGQLVRRGPQVETTHPKVIELFVKRIHAAYEKNIRAGLWTAQTPAAFPIGPADGLGYSLSAESLSAGAGRIDPIVGELDRTDELVLLGNRVLEQVHKTYPNAMVGFYSYSTHADYPMRHHPDPRLVQIFAPINFSRFHSLLDTNSRTQPYYRSVVEQWGELSRKQGNPLIYRGYNWNLADNMLPYTKARIWGQELPYYHQKGFLGLSVEATKAWSINGLSDYLFMRLAWDATLDWRDLLAEYCHKAYGPGAADMQRFHLRHIDTQHNAGQEAGSYHAFPLIYDQAFIAQARQDIRQAKLAGPDDRQMARIDMVLHSIEALDLYLAYHRATLAFDFALASDLYDALYRHWQTAHTANPDTVANETPQYLKRFLENFVSQALAHSSGEHRIVHRIPDELVTLHDPLVVGHRLNYHSPALPDEGFARTRTISTTWDAQGLTGLRDGAVWYRVPFTLPADAKDQPIGLFIGGVEDEARVWLNGQSIGASGRGFSVPFLFDLTSAIDYDGPNLLAIQVVRHSKANEIGLGGLLRPSFLFTGPRLERQSPKPLQLRRVLPGGELGPLE